MYQSYRINIRASRDAYISPRWAIDAVSLNASAFSSALNPRVSKATSVNSNSSASSIESTLTFPWLKNRFLVIFQIDPRNLKKK